MSMDKHIGIPRLSGNGLKLLAAAAMLADHAGAILFPQVMALRVIGRVAFPVFAFMVAQGCKYTHSELRYFLGMFSLGVVCQLVYAAAATADRFNILLTFSVSILLSIVLYRVKRALYFRAWLRAAAASAVFLLAVVMTYYVNQKYPFDYGFWGCMTAVLAGVFQQRKDAPESWKAADRNGLHVAMLAIPLLLIAQDSLQLCSLFALPLLLCYSGKRGKLPLKHFFYIFYPLHLAVLYGLAVLLK